jgi:hypothetical protein
MRGTMGGMNDDGQQSRNAPKCVSDHHQFEFFDNFPGYEIDECKKCGLRKFRNLETAEVTYGRREEKSSPPRSRKLRIAWSTACGVIALLIITLWVWSFWWGFKIHRFSRARVYSSFYVEAGQFGYHSHEVLPRDGRLPAKNEEYDPMAAPDFPAKPWTLDAFPAKAGQPIVPWIVTQTGSGFRWPLWPVIFVVGAAAVLPWWRGLQTLMPFSSSQP